MFDAALLHFSGWGARIVVALFCLACAAEAEPKPEAATIEVTVNQRQIAEMPILMELKLTNIGTKPISYWCGGPAEYPPADPFTAIVTDGTGRESHLHLSNGQYVQGSGSAVEIAPGAFATFPAVIDPLPAGKFTFRIEVADNRDYTVTNGPTIIALPGKQAKPVQSIEVRVDPKTKREFEAEILARVRKREAFARHVATTYCVKSFVDAMVSDLSSDDNMTVSTSAEALGCVRELPRGCGANIKRAILKQLEASPSSQSALGDLAALAEQDGSDDSLDAVMAYIEAGRSWPASRYQLQNLSGFKQTRAAEALRRELQSGIPGRRFTAAAMLAKDRDPAAVPVLIAASKQVGDDDRKHAFYRLSDYWNDPRAVAAIEEGTKDVDQDVRNTAHNAELIVEQQLKAQKVREKTAATQPVNFER